MNKRLFYDSMHCGPEDIAEKTRSQTNLGILVGLSITLAGSIVLSNYSTQVDNFCSRTFSDNQTLQAEEPYRYGN